MTRQSLDFARQGDVSLLDRSEDHLPPREERRTEEGAGPERTPFRIRVEKRIVFTIFPTEIMHTSTFSFHVQHWLLMTQKY